MSDLPMDDRPAARTARLADVQKKLYKAFDKAIGITNAPGWGGDVTHALNAAGTLARSIVAVEREIQNNTPAAP